MTKLGLVYMPRSTDEAVAIAKVADRAGFWGLGICDSPILYSEMYPVISACLSATSRLHVGPNVTNPVTRHWTVHGSALRTYEDISPGRFFLGIGAGDGAVYTVGLRPAKTARMREVVGEIRQAAPDTGEIQVAMGGPRGIAAVSPVADAVIVGTGADLTALDEMRRIARSACQDAGVSTPPRMWGLVALSVVDHESEVEKAKQEIRAVAYAYARHAFSHTFEGKNVPEEYQEILSSKFSEYEFRRHAKVTDSNPNAHLFDDHPEIGEYLLNRFAIVGTAEQCRARVDELSRQSDLDGIWMPILVQDAVGNVERAGEALAPLLAEHAH